jgi:hypothetical protein
MVHWYVGMFLEFHSAPRLMHHAATNADGKTESFWGFDHLGQVVEYLGLQRPDENRGWRAML